MVLVPVHIAVRSTQEEHIRTAYLQFACKPIAICSYIITKEFVIAIPLSYVYGCYTWVAIVASHKLLLNSELVY